LDEEVEESEPHDQHQPHKLAPSANTCQHLSKFTSGVHPSLFLRPAKILRDFGGANTRERATSNDLALSLGNRTKRSLQAHRRSIARSSCWRPRANLEEDGIALKKKKKKRKKRNITPSLLPSFDFTSFDS